LGVVASELDWLLLWGSAAGFQVDKFSREDVVAVVTALLVTSN